MDIRLSMYTVNALMHRTMSPVELYDMNSSQMEEPLSYYFKIDLRTPIGKPVVVRRYKSPEIKLFSKVKNRVPLLAHLAVSRLSHLLHYSCNGQRISAPSAQSSIIPGRYHWELFIQQEAKEGEYASGKREKGSTSRRNPPTIKFLRCQGHKN